MIENYQLIDLTHQLDEQVPTWSGGCGFCLEVKLDYPQGLRVQAVRCHAGVGTHMDAPSHFIKGGKSIADVPISDLIAPLYVLDVSHIDNPDYLISAEEIKTFEKKVGGFRGQAFFAAYTGWERFWQTPARYRNVGEDGKMHFPGFSSRAAHFLLDRGIVGIGIDTLSPDGSNNGRGADHYPVHKAVLGAGKYIIENLCGLSQMPSAGAYILLAPPKVVGATEFAVRAIGFKMRL